MATKKQEKKQETANATINNRDATEYKARLVALLDAADAHKTFQEQIKGLKAYTGAKNRNALGALLDRHAKESFIGLKLERDKKLPAYARFFTDENGAPLRTKNGRTFKVNESYSNARKYILDTVFKKAAAQTAFDPEKEAEKEYKRLLKLSGYAATATKLEKKKILQLVEACIGYLDGIHTAQWKADGLD